MRWTCAGCWLVTAGFGLLVLPHQAFLPAYTERQLGLGPDGLGTLLTAVGIGGIIGALLTGSRFTNNREYRAMGAFTIVTGLGLLILGGIPTLAAALLGLAMVGIGSIGFWTAAQSTIQLIVPDRLVGRVMSVYVALSAGAMPLGSLALGSIAEQGDTRIVMFIGGVSALLLCLPLLLRRPAAGTTVKSHPAGAYLTAAMARPRLANQGDSLGGETQAAGVVDGKVSGGRERWL